MTKKSRDRRKAYRANRRYYLHLCRTMPMDELIFKKTRAIQQTEDLERQLAFYSESKADLPRFIKVLTDNEDENS